VGLGLYNLEVQENGDRREGEEEKADESSVSGVAVQGSAWCRRFWAAQQQEQFPPVLGVPTRTACKKERGGAATGVHFGSWDVDRGAISKCQAFYLPFPSLGHANDFALCTDFSRFRALFQTQRNRTAMS
jgi:hypothetical protein